MPSDSEVLNAVCIADYLRHKKLEIHLSLQDAASVVEVPFRNSTLNLATTRMVPNFETPDFESLSRYSGESDEQAISMDSFDLSKEIFVQDLKISS